MEENTNIFNNENDFHCVNNKCNDEEVDKNFIEAIKEWQITNSDLNEFIDDIIEIRNTNNTNE